MSGFKESLDGLFQQKVVDQAEENKKGLLKEKGFLSQQKEMEEEWLKEASLLTSVANTEVLSTLQLIAEKIKRNPPESFFAPTLTIEVVTDWNKSRSLPNEPYRIEYSRSGKKMLRRSYDPLFKKWGSWERPFAIASIFVFPGEEQRGTISDGFYGGSPSRSFGLRVEKGDFANKVVCFILADTPLGEEERTGPIILGDKQKLEKNILETFGQFYFKAEK